MTIIELARLSEDDARLYLERIVWPNGPTCPHCKTQHVTRLQGESHRKGLFQCNNCGCRQQFTVTVGTVMERTRITLVNWIMAFHLLCSSKKGFSALQLQRELKLGSYKTAWFLMHRIRFAMEQGQMREPLSGTVEVDEAYIGGKPRPGTGIKSKRGRGTEKAPIVVLVERNGQARSKPVDRVDAATLKGEIRVAVHHSSTIMTDEWPSYRGIGKEFAGGHKEILHANKQYSYFDKASGLHINTNTAESYFALVKRGHYGVYHSMSKQHLHRYCTEYEFRWNHRKVSDHARMDSAISGIGGKRLVYERPVK
jgi:transposase-like protein